MKMNQMTREIKNPWNNMPMSSSRRIDSTLDLDFFWITDDKGRYGLFLKSNLAFDKAAFEVKLKGIEILKRSSDSNKGELFLVLHSNEDWELFLSLCLDLINLCSKNPIPFDWISAIHNRLSRWQKFLSQNNTHSLPLTVQMGLYSELSYLKDFILPNNSVEESINTWVGPDFNKQDFSLGHTMIEIKSYLTSKGPIVQISSLHQLDDADKPLILVSYGITRTDSGSSIRDLVQSILAIIGSNHDRVSEIFGTKLAEYGYMEGVTEEPFYKFKTDKIRSFSISDSFPRILPKDIHKQIISAKYFIDLSRCLEFEISSSYQVTGR